MRAGMARTAPTIASTELIVGMEVHVELATRTRMFSRTANIAHADNFDGDPPPNSLIDPVILGLPGALPVMNKAAVEMAIMVGLALNCRIAPISRWDRKNYFYPDLPKGYQISQYDLPLCFDGVIDITCDGSTRRINIIRAHLEEDAGKLGHELPGGKAYEGSLVDFNRAGTPLLEIVSAPDMRSAGEAVACAQEIRSLCRFLGVSEAIMQRGHMRFEPNINVAITTADGHTAHTPIVEVKNLNSFKSLAGAIEHEYARQIEQWKADGLTHAPGRKSTRGWDDVRQCTVLQREKEDAHDYRYFPDADLPPVQVSDAWREELRARLPELPAARRLRYLQHYGIQPAEAATLTAERSVAEFFDACIEAHPRNTSAANAIAKFLLNAAARHANERETTIDRLGVSPAQIAQLLELRDQRLIGSNAADELLGLLCDPASNAAAPRDRDVRSLAVERGMMQVRDDARLEEWIEQAIIAQPQAAEDFAGGKDAAVGRIVGHIMKISQGQADAAAIQQKLRARLRP